MAASAYLNGHKGLGICLLPGFLVFWGTNELVSLNLSDMWRGSPLDRSTLFEGGLTLFGGVLASRPTTSW